MAPAVTSNTSPCARASHLHAETVSTLPQAGSLEESSSPAMSAVQGEDAVSGTTDVVERLSRVLSSGSQDAMSLVDGDNLLTDTEKVMGSHTSESANVVPASSVSSITTSNSSCIVNLKDGQQQTLNILIKNNNGKCGTGIVQQNPLRDVCRIGDTLHSVSGSFCSSFRNNHTTTTVSSTETLARKLALSGELPVHRLVIIPKTLPTRPAVGSTVLAKSGAFPTVQAQSGIGSVMQLHGVSSTKLAQPIAASMIPVQPVVGSTAQLQSAICSTTLAMSSTVPTRPASPIVPKTLTHQSVTSLVTSVNDKKTVSCALAEMSNVDDKAACSILSSNTVDRVSARQRGLQLRIGRLLSRLRRLQTREANSFAKHQLSGLVSYLRLQKTELPIVDNTCNSSIVQDSRGPSMSRPVGFSHGQQLGSNILAGVTETAGRLTNSLRHLELAVDSDATESSSGGESDEDSNNETSCRTSVATKPPDQTRAQLAWFSERAMIASRWTWLQAQVSDIEYKIRQQSDIYRQLRQLKGSAVVYRSCSADVTTAQGLSDGGSNSETASSDAEKSTTNSDATCRAARCAAVRSCRKRRILRSVTTVLQPVNKCKPMALSTVRCTACYPPATPCALCAGRVNHSLQTSSQQSTIDRIALLDASFHPVLSFPQDILLSTRVGECIRSGVAYTANSPTTQPVQNTNTTAMTSRTSNSSGLTVRISKAHLKSCSIPPGMENGELRMLKLPRVRSSSAFHRDILSVDDDSSIQKSTAAKIFQGQSATRRAYDTLRRKKRLGLASKRLGRSATMTSLKPVGRPPRLSQSANSSLFKDALRRQSTSSTCRPVFDINNVIISYGSCTRLEVLQYKEIDTPKWRELANDELEEEASQRSRSFTSKLVPSKRLKQDTRRSESSEGIGFREASVDKEFGSLLNTARSSSMETVSAESEQETDSEIEDMSDEAFASRHLRHEIYERKQFFPTTGQRRRSNRSESDQSTLHRQRSPEPTPSFDVTIEHLPVSSYTQSSDPMLYLQDSLSPSVLTCDSNIRRNNSSSSAIAKMGTSFCFDPLVTSRFSEATNVADVIAADSRSWPPRSFPLDDSDLEQLQDGRPSRRRHSSIRHSFTATAPNCLPPPGISDSGDNSWAVVTKPAKTEDSAGAASTFVFKIAKM